MVNNGLDDSHVYRKRTYELLNVAKQGDFLSKLIDMALIVLILSNVLAIVLESVNEINQEYSRSFELFERFSVSIFTVEYLARVWSSVEARDTSGKELSRFKYIFTPSAIIDLIAILPFYIMLLGPSAVDLRILRVFRLLRIFKLTRYSQSMTLMLDAIREHIRSFIAAITILVVVMLLAASGMYIFEREAQPESFGSIPHAMWWAFATLTTVGYGDVTPITLWGKVFGATITVVGVGMVALPAGILASAFSEQLRMREKIYEEAVEKALEDGVVDDEEERILKETRENLELNTITAARIENALARVTLTQKETVESHNKCPHCGGNLRN